MILKNSLFHFYCISFSPEHILLIDNITPWLQLQNGFIIFSHNIFKNNILAMIYMFVIVSNISFHVFLQQYASSTKYVFLSILFLCFKFFCLGYVIFQFSENIDHDINFLVSITQFYNSLIILIGFTKLYF